MRTTNLNQFLRDAGKALTRSPEVRQAVSQATKQLEAKLAKEVTRGLERLSDRFEAPKAKPAPTPPSAAAASNGDYVKGLYRELLNREPDIGGFNAHMAGLAGGMSREQLRQGFLNSPEYAELQSRPQPSAPPEPVAAPRENLGDANKLGPVPLEGFDHGKLRDPGHNTVKYLFGRVATHFPLNEVKDHAGAERLLNKMVPDLQAAGLDILGVKGDRLLMRTPLGVESIDVVRGAGSGNPGWWWGADGKTASAAEIAKFPPLSSPKPPTGPAPTEPTNPGPAPELREPGAPLRTVPLKPEYLEANIDKSSPAAAVLSAARWVREKYAPLFDRAEDRNVCNEIMTHVIGALRVAGYDAHRVVNHPSMPDGARYGSDAVVLNGAVWDVYRAMGEASEPVAQNMGTYAAGRLRE